MASAEEKLELAKEHLKRVQGAWDPPDWALLSLFGFYCLEAAVDAAALHVGIDLEASHWRRVDATERLQEEHGLPEIAELLQDLNATRKSEVYGDVPAPDLDAEDVVSEVERYVAAVEELLADSDPEEGR